MQFVILGLLMIDRMSLYDLHKQFTAGLGLFYSASFGSIQRALRQLTDAGLVTVTDVPGSARRRKLHSVTAEGADAWRAWMRQPIGGSNAETALLAKVYLLGLLPADQDRREVLSALRRSVAAALAELEDLARNLDAQDVPSDYAGIFVYQRATLDYGLRSHELALQWLGDLPESTRASRPSRVCYQFTVILGEEATQGAREVINPHVCTRDPFPPAPMSDGAKDQVQSHWPSWCRIRGRGTLFLPPPRNDWTRCDSRHPRRGRSDRPGRRAARRAVPVD